MDVGLERLLEELKLNIINRHISAGQVASGRTKAGFEVKMLSPFRGQLLGYKYSGVLERGRRAGKIPKDFMAIIAKWAAVKGITFNSDKDRARFVYFVAKKIREQGTMMYRQRREEDIFTTATLRFEDILSIEIGALLEEEVKNKVFDVL